MSVGSETRAEPAGPTSNGALLSTDRVSKAFGGLMAVSDISIAVAPRSIVSIIGPNGAGKTTFFNMLTGLYKPTAGSDQLRRQGRDRTPPRHHHVAGRGADLPEHPPVLDDERRWRT